MFLKIWHSSAAFLFPYIASSESASGVQVDQQIRTELERAAEQAMVSSRNQNTTPAGEASQSSESLYSQIPVREKKRQVDNEGEQYLAPAATKRRRGSAKSYGDTALSSSASKPQRSRAKNVIIPANVNAAHAIDIKEPDQGPSTQSSRPPHSQMPESTTEQTIDDGNEDKATESDVKIPNHTLRSDDGVLDAHDQLRPYAGSATKSRKGEIARKRTKGSDGIHVVNGDRSRRSISGDHSKISSPTAAKATHQRFGSEDIEISQRIPSTDFQTLEGRQEDLSGDRSESEDEAPETVTASAGFKESRTIALDAAKVAARQEADKKLKRRERDQRLRLQAKSAKDSRSKAKPSSKDKGTKGSLPEAIKEDSQTSVREPKTLGEFPQINAGEGQTSQAKPNSSRKARLPLLLPEEVLAAEPTAHAPIPHVLKRKLAISQKRNLLDPEPKPPKDIKRGNVKVRVLQDNRSILPPKSSHVSKTLRESWLAGRKGFKGEVGVPRRKPCGSFARVNNERRALALTATR